MRDVSSTLATFPLWPIVDGRCACSDPNCTDVGKHPRVYWNAYLPGRVERGAMGSGMRTGAAFGVFVLDGDFKPDKGVDGEAEIAKLEAVQLPGIRSLLLEIKDSAGALASVGCHMRCCASARSLV